MNTTYEQFKKLSDHRLIVFDAIECVIGVMGSATNMMVLLAIYKERQLRTITNCFVGSLAASDVLVGLVVPPLVILSNERLQMNFTACVFLSSLVVLLTNISVLNLLSVALERFVAIRKPYMYCRWMSITRALYLVAATWLVATFIGLIPVMGWHSGEEGYTKCSFNRVISLEYLVYFIFFVVTLPPLVAMIFIYSYIFIVVRRIKHKTRTMSQGLYRIKKTIKRNTRGDLGILLVIVLFILCWMPLHIANNILLFSDLTIPLELYVMCNTLSRLNCLVNPFLFAFGYSRFKVVIKQILFKRCISIEDEVSGDKPELHNVNKLPFNHENMNEYPIEHVNMNEYPFRCVNTIEDLNSLATQPSERSGNTQRLVEDVSDVRSKKASVNDIIQLTDQSEMSDRKLSPDGAVWQVLDRLVLTHSVFDDSSYLFSVIDILSDDIVWEVGVSSSKARAKSKNKPVKENGEKNPQLSEGSVLSITKTVNILDELFEETNSVAEERRERESEGTNSDSETYIGTLVNESVE